MEDNIKTVALTEENIKKSLEFLGIDSSLLEKAEDGKLELKEEPKSGEESKTKEKKVEPPYKLSPEDYAALKKEHEEAEKKVAEEENKAKEELGEKPEDKNKEEKPESEDKEEDLFKKIEKSFTDILNNSISTIQNNLEKMEDMYKSEISALSNRNNRLLSKIESLEAVINKGFGVVEDKFLSVGELNKAILERTSIIEKGTSTIEKGLSDEFLSIDKRVRAIENTPNPRKSIMNKGEIIEKSFDSFGNPNSEYKYLSLNKDRGSIVQILQKKSGIDSEVQNPMYLDALSLYECSRSIEKGVIEDLYRRDKIIITE